jgi:Protein of unknown function (DUF1570)
MRPKARKPGEARKSIVMSISRQAYRAGTFFVVCAALVLAGCNTLRFASLTGDRSDRDPGPAVATQKSFRISQFVFQADFDVPRNVPIFQELGNLREQVYKELQLPPSNTLVKVQLFEDRDRYERFMQAKYPDLPKRRAFFVAQPHALGGGEDLLVYTYWGERIQQDLRHELTHALLHSVLKDVPLWLDEGLAEYYEVPAGWNGINPEHVKHLHVDAKTPFHADLARLEDFNEVQQMTPAEYREAWAWVHLMLRDTPDSKRVLVGYLRELRTNSKPSALRPRLAALYPSLETALARHLAQLETGLTPPATVKQ